MEGPLSKWTNVMKGWQYRWFVLDNSAGLLSYYTSKEKMVRGSRRGCVRLKGAILGIDDEDDSTFTITVDGKVFHLQARDAEERERWLRSLEDTIVCHQSVQEKWGHLKVSPTIHDFDAKLTEADAYLQILINQIKELDQKIELCMNTAAEPHCLQVKEKANVMLESIKHTIVLLQIAKNTAFPTNGVYQPVASVTIPARLQASSDSITTTKYNDTDGKCDLSCQTGPGLIRSEIVTAQIAKVETGLETFECESASPAVEVSTLSCDTLISHPIPDVSYSSSEDEDYFDATEYSPHTPVPVRPSNSDESLKIGSHSGNVPSTSSGARGSKRPASRSFLRSDGQLDYDALYEDDCEEDIGSMENQGSVISHLVSQVKIGMDLTKVVLPTFILETRSLLEMYADFFAHPDLFVSAVDFPTPQERMTQIVRWYLSAFHAGRKTSVAKKPYNPILGEIFECYWDVPNYESTSKKESTILKGVTSDKLCFVSEQVSHHPPISAFYAEHYNKRISCCAHIWTKSKFLGLSIGVHMIGQGCISLLDYDEEYILTFPNGYGRSILTVPWVELGGSVTVSCAKTGYSCQVEFITKPFYGGKKHRLTADLFRPNEKKPYLSVEGEWNGVMTGKWDNGKSEVFVDTTRLPIIKKKVKPVIEQQPNESRRLWKDVTAGLKLGNIDDATTAKLSLEQKQRTEAKQRLENKTKWETRLFHEAAGNWLYDHPLHKRDIKTS